MTERKYALTRIEAGDYLLLSNDGKKLWRVKKIIEGPSSGLDWPSDREVWGLWEWTGDLDKLDIEDWNLWNFYEGMHETRHSAIDSALKSKQPQPRRTGGKTLQEAIMSMAAGKPTVTPSGCK
jgi:hypothetical protein